MDIEANSYVVRYLDNAERGCILTVVNKKAYTFVSESMNELKSYQLSVLAQTRQSLQ